MPVGSQHLPLGDSRVIIRDIFGHFGDIAMVSVIAALSSISQAEVDSGVHNYILLVTAAVITVKLCHLSWLFIRSLRNKDLRGGSGRD